MRMPFPSILRPPIALVRLPSQSAFYCTTIVDDLLESLSPFNYTRRRHCTGVRAHIRPAYPDRKNRSGSLRADSMTCKFFAVPSALAYGEIDSLGRWIAHGSPLHRSRGGRARRTQCAREATAVVRSSSSSSPPSSLELGGSEGSIGCEGVERETERRESVIA